MGRRILAGLLVLIALSATQSANAATASLVSCVGGAITGQWIYTGTYNYASQTFEMSFRSWCPPTVQVR
jgi:hypothetical protein